MSITTIIVVEINQFCCLWHCILYTIMFYLPVREYSSKTTRYSSNFIISPVRLLQQVQKVATNLGSVAAKDLLCSSSSSTHQVRCGSIIFTTGQYPHPSLAYPAPPTYVKRAGLDYSHPGSQV